MLQVAFACGAAIPTLAMLLPSAKARLWGNIGAVSVGLLVFGMLGAYLGKFSLLRGSSRVVLGGWIALALTYAVGRAFGTSVA